MRPEQFPRTDAFANQLPQAVRQLPRREREVAMLIYRKGALTAMEIGSHVSGVSNGSIRTMLGRLVRKGILKRRPSGYGKTFLYVAAIGPAAVVEIALKRVAEDFYQGSIFKAAAAIHTYLAARRDFRNHG